MMNIEVRPYKWYCPRCGSLLVTLPDSKGRVQKKCKTCGALSRRTSAGRRTVQLTIIVRDAFENGIE